MVIYVRFESSWEVVFVSMFRYLTAGESHGPQLSAIIEGLPAGVHLTAEAVNHDLARRQHLL